MHAPALLDEIKERTVINLFEFFQSWSHSSKLSNCSLGRSQSREGFSLPIPARNERFNFFEGFAEGTVSEVPLRNFQELGSSPSGGEEFEVFFRGDAIIEAGSDDYSTVVAEGRSMKR